MQYVCLSFIFLLDKCYAHECIKKYNIIQQSHCLALDEKFVYENLEMRANKIVKRILYFKSTFTTKLIKQFSEIKCSLQTICAFHLRHVLFETYLDRVPFFAATVCIASMIFRTS